MRSGASCVICFCQQELWQFLVMVVLFMCVCLFIFYLIWVVTDVVVVVLVRVMIDAFALVVGCLILRGNKLVK